MYRVSSDFLKIMLQSLSKFVVGREWRRVFSVNFVFTPFIRYRDCSEESTAYDSYRCSISYKMARFWR